MIDLETIEQEIYELETRHDTSWFVCERLSILYTVRDHLKGSADVESPRLVDSRGGSEFMRAVDGKSVEGVLSVIDEHLEALRVVQPRAYDAVMDRLRDV